MPRTTSRLPVLIPFATWARVNRNRTRARPPCGRRGWAAPIVGTALVSSALGPAGQAIAAEWPSIAAVKANPKAYVGRTLAFRNASCADDPKGGFVCRITGGGHTIKIDASGLGASGGDEVAERLIGPCKGLDKITSAKCRFDIEIKPNSAQNEAVMLEFEGERVTRLYSGIVEMTVSRGR